MLSMVAGTRARESDEIRGPALPIRGVERKGRDGEALRSVRNRSRTEPIAKVARMVRAAGVIGTVKQGTRCRPRQIRRFIHMLKFINALRRNDRGDQLVGWVLLVSFVVLVGATTWSLISTNIGDVLTAVEVTTKEAATSVK
jgi:hypothetical protein